MKRRCFGWILGQLCDLGLWPHPWPWHCIFKVEFRNSCILGSVIWLMWNKKNVNQEDIGPTVCLCPLTAQPGTSIRPTMVTWVTSDVGVPSAHLVLLWYRHDYIHIYKTFDSDREFDSSFFAVLCCWQFRLLACDARDCSYICLRF